MEMIMPNDRDGSFELKSIGKRQTTLGEDLDNRILSLYSKGIGPPVRSYEDIQERLEDLYGLGQYRPVIGDHGQNLARR
jgi:putative transposase